jgi:hypothetical protein
MITTREVFIIKDDAHYRCALIAPRSEAAIYARATSIGGLEMPLSVLHKDAVNELLRKYLEQGAYVTVAAG